MNLKEFLVFIHNGAYHIAQQLIRFDLDVKDRKNLRAVSRAPNEVMLSFPILTCLHMSTYPEDLDYVQLVSGNERLLQHVTRLSWDHTVHDFLYLKAEALLQDQLKVQVTKLMREKLVQPRHNIETRRDLSLLKKILPFMKNVDTVRFGMDTWSLFFFGIKKGCLSPAQTLYLKWPKNSIDLAQYAKHCQWEQIADLWFPPRTIDYHPEVLLSELPADKLDMFNWHYMPVRGLKIFQLLLNAEGGRPRSLKHFFPKLKTLELHDFSMEFLDGPFLEFCEDSTAGMHRLDLEIDYHPDWLLESQTGIGPIISLAERGFSSLRHLRLQIDSDWFDEVVEVITKIIPKFDHLSSLDLDGWLTTLNALLALGDAISQKPSFTHLSLHSFIADGVDWDIMLPLWKDLKHLNHLSHILLDKVADEGREYVYVTLDDGEEKLPIVEWLNGRRSELPLRKVG